MHRPSTPRLRTELKGGANPCCTWQWGGAPMGCPKEGDTQRGACREGVPTTTVPLALAGAV
jgi:hypothetical protein